MAKLKCKCGNTFFQKIYVNEFKDSPASLHTPLQEFDPDHDIRLYKCISCGKITMPPVDYFVSSEEDKEVYSIIENALDGKIIERKKPFRSKRIHPGTAAFVTPN